MKTSLQPNVYPVGHTTFLVLLAVLLLPRLVLAECKELQIVEYEDRVEAVCVGEPLTEAQKKANQEEERRQEAAAAQRQRSEEQRLQSETALAKKAREAVDAEAERRKKSAQPGTPQKPSDKNTITDRNLRKSL
jgi:flagellar biosynthesis GTPase FlhF